MGAWGFRARAVPPHLRRRAPYTNGDRISHTLVSMKRHLTLGGKWLASASGVTALGYFVATEASGGRHPVWPYVLFVVLLLVGLAFYFACQGSENQDTTAGDDDAARAADQLADRQQIVRADHRDAAVAQHNDSPTAADQVWASWNEQYYNESEMSEEHGSLPGDPLANRWRGNPDTHERPWLSAPH